MKRIKKWFLHNPLLKLVSLALAFVLWLFVVNTSNPKVNASVTVSYDVLNEKAIESSNQIYFTDPSTVTVSYSVRTKYKNEIRPDSFTVYINLEDYSITGAVPVYIEIDSAVTDLISDVTVNPSVIHVTTEGIQQKQFRIEAYTTGAPAEGYRAGELSVVPEFIYVKGPISVIGKISSAGIAIDAEGATKDLEGITTVSFYDANGNELSGIEENLSFAGDVAYSLPVYRVKSLTVNAFPGGAPATGYVVDSVETSPTFISVYGPEEILKQYSYIRISGSDLNVSGMSENTTFNVDTEKYIPEGLSLATQTPEITVYVKFRNVNEQKEEKDGIPVVESPETSPVQESVIHTEAETVHQSTAESSAETERTSEPESTPEETFPTEQTEEETEPEPVPETEETESSDAEETSPQGQ